jgi:FkbM family methyltransferase
MLKSNLRSLSSIIKKLIPRTYHRYYDNIKHVKNNLFDFYSTKSYSHEGEDLILFRYLDHREQGFYVDVGAHHPKRFSNTYFFYKRGWRGINIDPNPEAINLLNKYRPRDINLQLGIYTKPGKLKYFMFDEPALNTFDEERADWLQNNTHYKIIAKEYIFVDRLDNVLNRYHKSEDKIDFMSIDVEKFELDVVNSNNWSHYRPTLLLIESLDSSLSSIFNDPLHDYISNKNYILHAKTKNTLVYLDAANTL